MDCSVFNRQLDSSRHNRTIIHIDMDCFYAQVEEIRDPTLRNKPLGIQQKNIVVTSNYIARDFGIKKLMLIDEAKKLCPHLVLVPGEDLTPYRQMSAKIFEILHKYTPFVEKLGLDENFLDVTEIVSQRLNGNFNDVVFDIKGCIYPLNNLLEDCPCGCAQRLTIGTHIAKEIRNDLYKTLGITCCAGISYNKLLAKLVGSQNKPNNQTVLVSSRDEEFMRDLNCLMKITGIGQKTESLLLENGIANINDLQNCDLEWLKKKFGYEMATKLKDLSFGRDTNPIRPTGKPKSISLEDSCRPISVKTDVEERFRLMLMRLIGQVSEDGRIPIAVKIIVRKYDAKKKSSHRETKQANILPSLFRILDSGQIMLADNSQEKLLKIIMRLFERIVDMKKPFNITLLGLAFSKFQERKNNGSTSIASFFIRKSDLEVQSVTSLINEGLNENPSVQNKLIMTPSTSYENFQTRRAVATASPIPMLVDMDSMSSDFSDISETDIEPSPKKTRLGILRAKRRLTPSESDISSPSKLRVAELRLNSRDSDKDSPISSPIATAVPVRMFSKINQMNYTATIMTSSNRQITRPNLSNRVEFLDTTTSNDISEISKKNDNQINISKNKEDSDCKMSTTNVTNSTLLTANVTNIPCPAGVDPDVFKDLPEDLQNELLINWNRNTMSANTSANPKPNSNNKTNGANTLHRYFIKNK